MSNYKFPPSPDLSTNEANYATWEGGFSESEIAAIIQIGEALPTNLGTISTNEVISDVRKSRVAWMGCTPDTIWLYEKLAVIVRQLNGQFFDFDIHGFLEDFQYTVYTSDHDHYDWHTDKGNLKNAPRKLSVTLQLSDESEYEGGELQFMYSQKPVVAEKKKGMLYLFPSYLLHRVTPVTAGTRKSLVVWIVGNKFR